jgi:hypothetical protein
VNEGAIKFLLPGVILKCLHKKFNGVFKIVNS